MITRKLLQSVLFVASNYYQKTKLGTNQRRNLMCLFASQQIVSTSGLLSVASPVLRRYCGGYNEYQAPIKIASERFYSNIDRKQIDLKVATGKKLLSDTIQSKRINLQQRKAVLVQELRDKKTKVKEKVKEMEEIVERENVLTIPNLLSVGRSILAPYVGYVIVNGDYQLAIGLLVVAGVTDLLDGFIARNWESQASKLGSFLDPMADKLLMGSLVISLTYCGLLPIWLSVMIILRDISLIIAVFVIRYMSLPTPRSITRYFDATHVTAKLKPTFTSKVNTAVQLLCIAGSLGAPMYGYVGHSLLHGLWYFTGCTTVAAALSYILSKDTYKIIKENKRKSAS